ncbi:unnamed protein product [Auanema sp. JU1783]|nr:unnamed protein product [Auanema sp. JU1783]
MSDSNTEFLICSERFRSKEDEMKTSTSTEQKRTESLVKFEVHNFLAHQVSTPQLLLNRVEHVHYLLRSLKELGNSYVTLDASRTWLCYWAVHALNVLEAEIPAELKSEIVIFLRTCEHPDGGYGGGPGQYPHLAPTYAAVMCLLSLKTEEALQSINRQKIKSFLLTMKQPNGGFSMHNGGEIDMRGAYCALSVAGILGILDPVLKEGAAEWIVCCQTYEGGFGGEPGVEAHGGYAFCAVAALVLLDKYRLMDDDKFIHWLAHRQLKYEGGFQGRTNKLVDGCYSFWQAAAFPLLEKELERNHRQVDQSLFNSRMLEEYILVGCQDPRGGLRDKPDKPRDLYHTCYVLSGYSVAQYYSLKSGNIVGDGSNKVAPINPLFNITAESEKFATNFFV